MADATECRNTKCNVESAVQSAAICDAYAANNTLQTARRSLTVSMAVCDTGTGA